ncbi:hypothetical protein S40293_06257 [Stachybotrys chartarum IBT 40293]|nr:hypothetical protein S40293_06257 [Stachybotrys chartarum IBT 40293]KFA76886.1 hypothetical protein S40288_09301 [Stachybotrys chartarum IBT 40288]
MVVVAVAGGRGGVGRAIVEAFIAQGKHTIKILTRELNAAKEAEVGAPSIAVDYANTPSLTSVLEHHDIRTVVSALDMMPFTAGPSEPKLIKAADASKCTKA